MKSSGHGKLLCEFLKLSKLNAFILLGYQKNTDASVLVYKHRPEKTGFNMYAENIQQQLTFLALLPWIYLSIYIFILLKELCLCHKLRISNPDIFAIQCRRPEIFQNMNYVRPNNLSLKYKRFTRCKDIGIRKFEIMAKTQFLPKMGI